MDHTGDEDLAGGPTHERFIDDMLKHGPTQRLMDGRLRPPSTPGLARDKALERPTTVWSPAEGLRRHVSTLPVPLGDRRSFVRGDLTTRSFPEMPAKRPETASGPMAGGERWSSGFGTCSPTTQTLRPPFHQGAAALEQD